MGLILTTEMVPGRDRLSYWTDVICQSCEPVACESTFDDGFTGDVHFKSMSNLGVSLLTSCPQTMLRTKSDIAKSNRDYFIVDLITSGSAVCKQDNRVAFLKQGDYVMYDTSRPYELMFEDYFRMISLKFPTSRLTEHLQDTHKMTAMTVSGNTNSGKVLVSMIQSIWDDIDNLNSTASQALSNGVINTLMAGLSTLPVEKHRFLPNLAEYHLLRIKNLIESNLSDPNLTLTSLSGSLGISVSHLHRLFKNEGLSPSHYILNRRLEACSEDLLNPKYRSKSISEIAYSKGFNDAAHFSRVFKERFNCSPRDWRTF